MQALILSQYPSAVRGMLRACASAGVSVTDLICVRGSRSTPPAIRRSLAVQAEGLLRVIPDGITLHVVTRKSDLVRLVRSLRPQLGLCRGFSMRIPKEGLQEFEIGAMNLHPSGLPNWRGPFPVHHAISQGHRAVNLTGHWMTETIDEGPVLLQRDVEIAAGSFGERIWSSIDRGFESLLRDILASAPELGPGVEQQHASSTYAGAFDETFRWLDPQLSAQKNHDRVRAYSVGGMGESCAYAVVEGETWQVNRTSLEPLSGTPFICVDAPLSIVDGHPVNQAKK